MQLHWTFILLSASLAQGSPYEYIANSPPIPIPAVPAPTLPNVSSTAPQPMTVSTEMAASLSSASAVSPEWSSSVKASVDAYIASSPPDAQSTVASVVPAESLPRTTAMASSSMPAKPMPSDPMPIAPVPTMPPMIAVDPVPSVPPMPSLPAPTVPVPAFPALATTSTSPDQALVVIEFVPILVQPTNDPLDSTADCEESVEETPDPESCTDAVDVPLFQTLSVPMPVAPAPSAPIPVEPIPSAPMPVEPVPSAPVPVEPVPVAPVLSAPVPVAPVPSAPMPSEPIPIVPMPATPSSQAPLLPPIVTPVYQNIVTIENSVSPSEEGPITFTYTEIITDDTTTDNLTIPYCEDEIPPPYSATVPTDAPMVTLPEPIPATVPAVPAPMPTTVPAVPAPMPTTVPAVPAVPAPSSEIDSASENGATCTPEFLTVTIYDDIQIDPVTVTEYVPYFIPVDTNMWTYLLPTPPLAPGPVIWTGAPPSLVPELSTAGQPEIPAPSSAPAVPVAPCSTSSWIRT